MGEISLVASIGFMHYFCAIGTSGEGGEAVRFADSVG